MPDAITGDRLLTTFLELVAIDSPSYSEAACAAYCARALEDAGCSVRFDRSDVVTGSNTGNLIAEFAGTRSVTLVLSAHLDCVEPCRGVRAVVEDGVVRSSGSTVLGADDKAGIASIIEAVRLLAEMPVRPDVRVVLSVGEEVGLVGAKALAAQDVTGDLCLVLDADGSPGDIIIGAPTHYTFTASFHGRAAHAGVAPENGLSAIRMAADAITRMELGRLDASTTANVGSICGGTATNVIPEAVILTGECRSLDSDRVEVVKTALTDALEGAAADAGGSVEIAWKLEYGGFSLPSDSAVVTLLCDACERAGLEARMKVTGGGSDANIIAALGVPTLALGCGMRDVHSVRESVRVDDLHAMTDLVLAAAAILAERA